MVKDGQVRQLLRLVKHGDDAGGSGKEDGHG